MFLSLFRRTSSTRFLPQMWNIHQDRRRCLTTNTWQHKLILFVVVPIMAKTTADSIPTEMAPSSKATLRGKSKQKKERGIGVATGASDVVSEVHYPNKSNSIMQQNANINVKCNDNNNTKSHPNTKKTCAERRNFHTSSISTKFPQCVECEKRQHQITPKHQKTFAECHNFHTASLPTKVP